MKPVRFNRRFEDAVIRRQDQVLAIGMSLELKQRRVGGDQRSVVLLPRYSQIEFQWIVEAP